MSNSELEPTARLLRLLFTETVTLVTLDPIVPLTELLDAGGVFTWICKKIDEGRN